METKREELIKKLKDVIFGAHITVLPSEMCLEIITMTSEGTSYRWISYDEWNVFELQPCDSLRWGLIKGKIENNELLSSDFVNTDFEKLINNLEIDDSASFSTLFSDLLANEFCASDTLYCFYNDVEQTLHFFPNKKALAEALSYIFVDCDTAWEEMETETLEEWVAGYEDGLYDIPCLSLGSED